MESVRFCNFTLNRLWSENMLHWSYASYQYNFMKPFDSTFLTKFPNNVLYGWNEDYTIVLYPQQCGWVVYFSVKWKTFSHTFLTHNQRTLISALKFTLMYIKRLILIPMLIFDIFQPIVSLIYVYGNMTVLACGYN